MSNAKEKTLISEDYLNNLDKEKESLIKFKSRKDLYDENIDIENENIKVGKGYNENTEVKRKDGISKILSIPLGEKDKHHQLVAEVQAFAYEEGIDIEQYQPETIIIAVRDSLHNLVKPKSLAELCPELQNWVADRNERKKYLKRISTTGKDGRKGSKLETPYEFLLRCLKEVGIGEDSLPYLHEIREANPILATSLGSYMQKNSNHKIPIMTTNKAKKLIKSI